MGVPYQGVDMTSHLQYVTVRNEVRICVCQAHVVCVKRVLCV